MKLLIIGDFHIKNKLGLSNLLNHLKYEYKYGSVNEIEQFDIIYSPGTAINVSKYPKQKFIMGPHFSVFPNEKQLKNINNVHNNALYIQPSDWATEVWVQLNIKQYLPIYTFSFPVDTDRFSPVDQDKNKIFLYYKRRDPNELKFLMQFLNNQKIHFKLFNYTAGYDENEYLQYLQQSKYGIILDAHESQGFAIEEALSCNVPLLVWNTKFMSQEYGGKYPNYPCNSIAYWDKRCGEFFFEQKDFPSTFELFLSKIDTYQPRQYILENLSVEKCAERWVDLTNKLN